MNYIYDIFLNYDKNLYEVFDWNKEDKLTHIRKIPLVIVKTEDLYNLVNKIVTFDLEFLNKIYQKTEIFNKRKIEYIEYSFLATDKKELIAFKLNKNGNIIQYSKLLYEEEEEVLNYSKSLGFKNINYKVQKKKENFSFKTRNEDKIKKYIYEELEKIKNNSNKIKFLYFECFGNTKNKNLLKEIHYKLENNWENNYIEVYNCLKNIAIKR